MESTDLVKSTPQDQMSEMMLLMQMEKLSPEFCSGSPSDFSSGESALPRNLYETTAMNNFLSPPFHHSNPYPSIPPAGVPGNCTGDDSNKQGSMAAMRDMIFRIAAMQPIHIDPESVKPPKRRNVRISKDPQSVAARHRRERISERIRILQRLVPGGTKMDTASMLDEAIHYVKFLRSQVLSLERVAISRPPPCGGAGFPVVVSEGGYFPVMKGYPVMQSGQESLQQGQAYHRMVD